MIYVDTSVVLAHLLAEDRIPPSSIWREPLISSRLLEYEVWTRIHSRGLTQSHDSLVRDVLSRISFLELASQVVHRAVEPFPTPVRTLDALHLASIEFLVNRRQKPKLASYDVKMIAAAQKLGIEIFSLL